MCLNKSFFGNFSAYSCVCVCCLNESEREGLDILRDVLVVVVMSMLLTMRVRDIATERVEGLSSV